MFLWQISMKTITVYIHIHYMSCLFRAIMVLTGCLLRRAGCQHVPHLGGKHKRKHFCQWLWTFAIGNFITTCSGNSVISCWFFSSCGPARSLSQAPFRGLVEKGDVQWAGSGRVVWSVMGTGTLLLLVCLFKRLLELPIVSYACHNSFAGH